MSPWPKDLGSGLSAARMAAMPGLEMGPGVKPAVW